MSIFVNIININELSMGIFVVSGVSELAINPVERYSLNTRLK